MRLRRQFRLVIDASPLAEVRQTGIPHVTAEMVKALLNHPDHGKKFNVVLVIAIDRRQQLKRWNFEGATYRYIPLPFRITNLVWKYNVLPPLDLFFGKGVYVFPNYRNWPLLFSKSLTYIHDLGYIRFPESVQPKNLAFLRANMGRWLKRATVIITGSVHAKEEIELLLRPARPIYCVYHGVDSSVYYRRDKAEVDRVKKRYDLPDQYFLYVGSLEPRKNLKRLIEAYCSLPKSSQAKAALVLVGGGGWLNEGILEAVDKARTEGASVVRVSKYVEDVDLPALYSGAVALVHPALYEGFGLSPLQAMACGTPVVTADNSSLPEVVGDAGLLVNADDAADISDKMNTILRDHMLRDKLVARGQKQAAKFTWENTAQGILDQAERVK